MGSIEGCGWIFSSERLLFFRLDTCSGIRAEWIHDDRGVGILPHDGKYLTAIIGGLLPARRPARGIVLNALRRSSVIGQIV